MHAYVYVLAALHKFVVYDREIFYVEREPCSMHTIPMVGIMFNT